MIYYSSLLLLPEVLSSEGDSSLNSTFACTTSFSILTSLVLFAETKGDNLARLMRTASSVRIVLLPWKGHILTLKGSESSTNMRDERNYSCSHGTKTYHMSKSFLLWDPGIFRVSSASTHSSIPATPPNTTIACLNFGNENLWSSTEMSPLSLVPIFRS